MNCPNCHTINEKDNLFCVSCGEHLTPTNKAGNQDLPPTVIGVNVPPPPTQFYNPNQTNYRDDSPDSIPTAFRTTPQFNQSPPNFNPLIPNAGTPVKSNTGKFFLVSALALLLLIGGGIGAFFIVRKQTASTEVLPDHLGLFALNKETNNLSELSKFDSTNAVSTKDDLLKNESLPTTDEKPNLILYSDGKDIPLGDLKLVQLDSIKDDGSLKQINFQTVPVEGKTELKRLRVPDGLANGKYAFALLDGFLDQGKHKFWAFQVKNSAKADNGDLARALTLSLKPKIETPANINIANANTATVVKAAPTPKPEPMVPAGARVAYCGSSNVIMRGAPSLTAKKVNGLRRGQKIYVINYSDNYDYWNGMEGNWAYVQTESGGRGWVFSPLITY